MPKYSFKRNLFFAIWGGSMTDSGLPATTEGRIALFTSELVESGLIMLQKNRAGHGQGQGYKF